MRNIRSVLVLIILFVFLSIFAGTASATNDTTAPKVSSINPSNNSCNVATDKILKIVFNEPIKAGTNYIELKDNNKTIISINKTFGTRVLTITPNKPLKNGIKYTLHLYSGSYRESSWQSSYRTYY